MQLSGEYKHVIDNKGRVLIATKLRNQIDVEESGKDFYLVLGANGILCLYPDRFFERMVLSIVPHVSASDELVAFERLSHAFSSKVELDSQGRILLAEYLRKRAGLKQQIMLIGVRDHIELWNEDAWAQYVTNHMPLYQRQMSEVRHYALQNKTEGAS